MSTEGMAIYWVFLVHELDLELKRRVNNNNKVYSLSHDVVTRDVDYEFRLLTVLVFIRP